MQTKAWIEAFRPRTLPLALSCIAMGGFLAASAGAFRWDIFLLCSLTTVLLQILSNLANDYGDAVNGADHQGRIGPARAVQSGAISRNAMRRALILFVMLCLASGIALLWISLEGNFETMLYFFGLGVVSILAAIAYTVGRKPYGYAGLGDFSVLVFFGIVGVLGSLYLFTKSIRWDHILPAMSCGFFSMGVLNINNIRDIESDRQAGKFSVPVRIGRERAVIYHWILILSGLASAIAYTFINFNSYFQWLFIITIPLFLVNAASVNRKRAADLDPYLKQLAISTLAFVLLFGIGILL
ncbi:MAG TPA: 1,4-dihydroxy-2-naphthoate polyprenyltransferase [Cyclobacteriaceae bacterium]|nr:1,4-dihydroxy-2-naphthoate polyprenyltransferase [Cyclobacteriaceae bacterium]